MSTSSFAKEVWETLSQIDVGEHIEKKGKLSYLSWAWAWGTLMKNFPESQYTFNKEGEFPDGSMEVSCRMNICADGKQIERTMWLPVMDHRNNSITNPTSRQISDSRMRCLVKCLAMFGLGHYIYAGEELPEQKPLKEWVKENKESIATIKASIEKYGEDGDIQELLPGAEVWWQLPGEVKQSLWVAPTKDKDAPFTTEEREVMKSTEFRVAYYGEEEKAA